jgi:endo-1,4-beta-xylanase
VLDELLDADVPVHALGIQAHLNGGIFADKFDPDGYRGFLGEVADRGLKILVTEMDILDDGLPSSISVRDRRIADVAKSFLDVALEEPAVASLVTFGLSDRYTWLEEDYPRKDGMPRRPLPFDQRLRPKRSTTLWRAVLNEAPLRDYLWVPPRC